MGGGGSNNAQEQADRNERERQAQIASSTASINRIFDDPARQAQYDKLTADTTQFYTDDLNQQNEDAQRKLKFALARSGNTGGSLQVSQGQRLGEDYEKGLIEASRRGQAAGASLRSSDEQTRSNLIAAAQAGLDATTAGSQAASSLRANLDSSRADATANMLGDSFANFADLWRKSQDDKAYRQQFRNGLSLYSPMYGAGSQTGY